MGKIIKCESCDGNYVVRTSKRKDFVCCTNYPKCSSTKSIYYLITKYIEKYGVNNTVGKEDATDAAKKQGYILIISVMI